MVDERLAYTPAIDLLELIAAKQVSPVELAEMFFERIDRLDPQLNSFLLLTRDLAMGQARAAEDAVMRGDRLGALHGLPVPIKDTQMTAGVRTTMGSVVYENRVPERNSAVAERVLNAGAVMLGKTNVPEFGMVGCCENSLGVLGHNPWNTDRTPGGSSGGAAAAVAAYLCPVATGSDGGGSLRIPANFCGIYTIKPTQGRVSGYTGLGGPPMPNIFSQPGPLTRTVRDAAMVLQVLAGFDRRDQASIRQTPPDFMAATERGIDGLRIGWSADFGFAPVFPEVVDVTYKAAMVFEEMGLCRRRGEHGPPRAVRLARAHAVCQRVRRPGPVPRRVRRSDDRVCTVLHRDGVARHARRLHARRGTHSRAQGHLRRRLRDV